MARVLEGVVVRVFAHRGLMVVLRGVEGADHSPRLRRAILTPAPAPGAGVGVAARGVAFSVWILWFRFFRVGVV